MKKLLLSLFATAALAFSASASEATFDFSDPAAFGYEGKSNSGTDYSTPLVADGVTITCDTKTAVTGGGMLRFWFPTSGNPDFRCSATGGKLNQTLTFTADGATITKIEFTAAKFALKANVGTLSAYASKKATWTGEETEVVFTTTDACTFNTIVVTYEGGSSKLNPELSFGDVTEYTVNLGETFTAPKLTFATNAEITYESSNEAVAGVDENTGAVTLMGAGTTTIKATAEANDQYKAGSASYTLTVVDPSNVAIYESAKGVDFTFENPEGLNVWTHDNTYGLKGAAYIGGKTNAAEAIAVSPVINLQQYKDVKLNFKNAFNNYKKNNVMIPVADFEGYAEIVVREAGATEWTSIAEATAPAAFSWTFFENETVSLADYAGKIIQFGFKYISTAEVAGTWEIQAITLSGAKAETAKQDAGLAFAATALRAALGTAFTAPALTNPNNLDVTYTSSNPAVATVAADGAVTLLAPGTTTITAISPETALFFEGVASYELTVITAYNTLEAFYGIGANNYGIIGFNLTATYVNGLNCYAQTADGEATLIYGTNSYKVGDIIPAGWEGQYAPYQGLPEIKPASTLPAADGTADFTPAQVNAVSMADLNRVLVLKDVAFEAPTASGSTKVNFTGKVGETEYTFRNNFTNVASVEAGTYNVTLAVGCYNSALQLYPIEYAPSTSGIDAIELGDNAPVEYYNLQGVRIENPANGLYIRRQGSKATKVLIK